MLRPRLAVSFSPPLSSVPHPKPKTELCLKNNADDTRDYQISDDGMLAGLSPPLHIAFTFHEELGRAAAVCPSPCGLVPWQHTFLVVMWEIPPLPQSDGGARWWIKERQQKIWKQHDTMR